MLKNPEEPRPRPGTAEAQGRLSELLLRFGEFTLDLERHGLYRGEERIHLTGKPFETLVFLVENRGSIVTKQKLLDAVWTDLFVSENSLEHAIAEIRRALGDERENPRFIQTVPRQGYRFIARVSEKEVQRADRAREEGGQRRDTSPDDQQVPTPSLRLVTQIRLGQGASPGRQTLAAPRWKHWHVATVTLALVVCLIALAGVFMLWLRPALPAPRVLHSTQITNSSSVKLAPIVTDGSRLYFMEMRNGRYALTQVSAAGGESVLVATPFPNAYLCDISPDRSKLLVRSFTNHWREEGPLWVLSVMGGSPQRLGDMLAFDGSWSVDGQQIVYTTGHHVYVANSDGSASRKLLSVAGEPWWPRWSPDGSRLRFAVFDPPTNANSLWEFSTRTLTLKRLPLHGGSPSADCCGNWTPDGTYFLFQSSRNRVDSIYAIRERAAVFYKVRREPVQLTTGPVNFRGPVLSKEGDRFFVKGTLLRAELAQYDARSRRFGAFLPGTSVETLDVSRDGNWLAYATLPEGLLWRSRADGSQRLQLTFSPMRAALPAWAPDGERVAFMARLPGEPWKIHMVSANGGNSQAVMREGHDEADPGWSPDGNLLVFGRLDTNASRAIYLLEMRTGKTTTLPGSEGLFSPRWSPDGRYIAALPGDAGKLVLFDFTTQKWTDLSNLNAGYPTWSRDGKYIYFFHRGQDEQAILRVRIRDRKVQRVVGLRDLREPPTTFGRWIGLDPSGAPLALRDLSTQEIYAFEWQAP